MTFLYVALALSAVLLLGAALGAYLRVRRQLYASDERLREALRELESRRQSTKV
jgi:hypothetical protein